MAKVVVHDSASILDLALRRIERRVEGRQLFLLWPNLRRAALKLCVYLSPYLEQRNRPLLDIALERGIAALIHAPSGQQVSAFIHAIASIADDLCQMQISVEDREGDWAIWDFENPILDWMRAYQRECVQIRQRDVPFPIGAVRLALISRVFSIRDLLHVHLEVVTQPSAMSVGDN